MKKVLFEKLIILVILFLFIGVGVSPIIESSEQEKNFPSSDKISRDQIQILKQIGPVGTYEDYINSRENKPYIFQKISEPVSKTSPLVIIFIEVDLVTDISDEIILYNETLGMFGYDSVIFQVSGVETEDLKDKIINYWDNGYDVCGSVIIGNLPTEWFHHENDFYGPAEFPCDLFLMDLDGTWTDTDSDGMYDTHTDGSGDTAPEVFIGRIDASRVPGDEITILKKYFAKVYDFWSGNINQTLYGLTYTDQDWASYPEFRHDIGYAYEDYEAIWYPDVDRDDYVNNRIPSTYEFIQLSCHSSSAGHSFTLGGWATSDDIRKAPPRALFYNLFCCSSLRFTDNNCLGNAYILDTDTPSLAVVGSAKTGSMLDFRYFYEPIGNGESFGTAFKEWFEWEYPYDDTDISWFYGMTILGDPTLIIHCLKNLPPSGTNFTGPDEGITDKEYTFCIDVFDREENLIYCNWDWGDGTSTGWLGPYSSGETICASHQWSDAGDYEIKIKLKDEMGSETAWSDPHIIHIIQGPLLEIDMIRGGFFKVNAVVKNIGAVDSTEVNWIITLDGGAWIGEETTGIIPSIEANSYATIKSDFILGLGETKISVSAEIPESSDSRQQNGKIFLFYIKVNPGGGI
jgi:hypothetical protein